MQFLSLKYTLFIKPNISLIFQYRLNFSESFHYTSGSTVGNFEINPLNYTFSSTLKPSSLYYLGSNFTI